MVVQIMILVFIAIIVFVALIACFSLLKSKTNSDHDSDESVFEDDNDGVQFVTRPHCSDTRRATFGCEDLPLETFPMYRDVYVPIVTPSSNRQTPVVHALPVLSWPEDPPVEDSPPAYNECVDVETTRV